MKKHDWAIHFTALFLIWGLDFLTKILAVEYVRGTNFFGPLGFVLWYNPGAMLGAFADLPPVLRIVSLSTGGAFLVFIYISLQYLIPQPAKLLRWGMTILLGGILGNVSDRIYQGKVVDFFILSAFGKTSPVFNLADVIQWVGYFMIVYTLVRDGHVIWPEHNYRRQWWVNRSFQFKYIGWLMVMGTGFITIAGVFFYTYLKITIEDLVVGISPEMEDRYLKPFFLTFIVIAIGFMFLLFIIGRILSHRVAGPLFAFERFLSDILQGIDRPMRLRPGDEFKHLEELGEKLRKMVINKGPDQSI
jgi:signal peptidase II